MSIRQTAGAAVAASLLVYAAAHAQTNLVVNGDFEKTTDPWYGQIQRDQKPVRVPELLAREPADTPDKSAGALKVTVRKDPSAYYPSHGAGAFCPLSEQIAADTDATVVFWAKSLSGPKVLGIQRAAGGGGVTIVLTDTWAKYEVVFRSAFETNALVFGVVPQNVPGIQQLADGEFLLDNLSVVTVLPDVTQADVSYGPHPRQKFDFWRAPGTTSAPVLVFIHGGGWLGGDKVFPSFRATVARLHRRGVSAATVNYRYSSEAPLPAPVHDAARAIQYLRSKAAEWGVDKTRIAATGDSAGGCTVLWLATHDDLADPQSVDPVARESTRLCGGVAFGAQSTIDPLVIRRDVYETALAHQMICRGAGFPDNKAMDAGYDKAAALYHEFSPINHLSADDPPTWLSYTGPVTDPAEGIHSSRFGVIFKKRADEVGATCYLGIHKNPELYPKPPEMWEFLYGVLKGG